jgi:hypothetical protein
MKMWGLQAQIKELRAALHYGVGALTELKRQCTPGSDVDDYLGGVIDHLQKALDKRD